MKLGQRPFLHRQIGLDVLMGRDRTLMAQPQRDHADVDAGLQEMHRRRVANHMGRNVALR
ncbi:hypothetical protein D9M68_949630 [compost metagenome]